MARTTCGPHVKSWTLELKPHVHTIKFYWNWPKFVRADLVWLAATLCKAVWLDLHVGPTSRPDSENKISRSHYKILLKLTEICWKWLSMTGCYSVQSSVARPTRGPHVKSRTLKLKPRIHTIKFYPKWLKFVGNDSVWLTATLCKEIWLDLHVGST